MPHFKVCQVLLLYAILHSLLDLGGNSRVGIYRAMRLQIVFEYNSAAADDPQLSLELPDLVQNLAWW